MIFLELYWSFVKIGFTSFGGLSMIPLISSEMLSHGWMSADQVADIVAIAEMTPGPLGINCATFAGMKTAGVLGALAASIGILTPTLTLTAVIAIFFERFKTSKRMQQVMTGVRPACIGMVLGVTLSMCLTNYATAGQIDLRAVLIGVLDLLLLMKWKLGIPKVILLSAALGVLLFGAL